MIIPTLRYEDAKRAIDFLERAFGLERRSVHENGDGTIGHAELTHGRGMVMIGSAREGDRFESGRAVIYVIVDDPTPSTNARRPRGDDRQGAHRPGLRLARVRRRGSGGQRVVVRNLRSVPQLRRVSRIANPFAGCYNSSHALTDRPAHSDLSHRPAGAGYSHFSYRAWRFS
jgi:hypothetical protein